VANSPAVIPTPTDQPLPGAPSVGSNPRYPGVVTYSNTANGFFSVVGAASFQLSSTQTVYGHAAYSNGVYIAIKRLDTSGLYWIDLYRVTVSTSSSSASSASLQCSIRYDGNFTASLAYDQGSIYIHSISYPYNLRKFDASNCLEGTAVAIPPASGSWSAEGSYDVFNGQLQGVYYASGAYSLRTYNSITGTMTTVVQAPKWNDYQINFSSNFSRSSRGVWGVNRGQNSRYNFYFTNPTSGDGRFAPLPNSDYPDFSQSGQGSMMGISVASDKTGYIAILFSDRIRIYMLDIESF